MGVFRAGIMSSAMGLLRGFAKDGRGNFATIFALSLVPLLTAAGAAVDLNRAYVVHERLLHALDAAGLAVGAAPRGDQAAMEKIANDYFNANYPAQELGVPSALQVNLTDATVTLSATAELPTTIISIVGIDTLTVGGEVEVTRENKALEIVLVLDNTGSMAYSSKISTLRTAATSLINTLFGDQATPDLLKVGLVPFVTTVNIKADSYDSSWMDTSAQSTWHGTNFNESGGPVNHFDLFDGVGNTEWKGCVEMRPEPYDTTDDAPSSADPDTLFVPWFWPDEPDTGTGYKNNYTADDTNGSQPTRQAYTGKYDGADMTIDEEPSTTSGPNKSCPQPLRPLTNVKQTLLDDIDDMEPWNDSGTNIVAGLVWGWRVLSPTAPFTEGASYSDEDTQKALVLLTDGENQVVSQGGSSFNVSDYTGYGYMNQERLGTDDIWTARGIIDDKVEDLCEAVKDKGIRVYTITFQLSSSDLQEVFRNCATEEQLYFDSPTNAELENAFQAIAYDLSNLRISR